MMVDEIQTRTYRNSPKQKEELQAAMETEATN